MSRAYSGDLRERVVKNYAEGMQKIDIIKIFKIGKDTPNRRIRQYKETGTFLPKKQEKYRRRKFSDSELIDYIDKNPSATLEEIARNFSVKPPSVHSGLKLPGITRKKTFLYKERDERKRDEFTAQLELNRGNPFVYIDESGIKNNIKREYGRSLRGTPVLDEKRGGATEKLNIIAGLLDGRIISPLTYNCNTDTELFNLWLKQCLIPALPENSVIVMDNASFHKSSETKEIIESNGRRILFLPPYSPDLNPIEKFWAVMKSKIKKIIDGCSDLGTCVEIVFQTI